jgi:hypothetical protein
MFTRILFGAAFAALIVALATSALWAKLASPPVAIAASSRGLNIPQLERAAFYEGMPSTFEDLHQRHTGVLDVLITPWRPPHEAWRGQSDRSSQEASGRGGPDRRGATDNAEVASQSERTAVGGL